MIDERTRFEADDQCQKHQLGLNYRSGWKKRGPLKSGTDRKFSDLPNGLKPYGETLSSQEKKNWKIKTWIYDVARFVCCRKNYGAPVEKLCWSCLSPTLNLFHPPCPLRLKLLGSSMALLPGKLLMLPFSGRRWLRLHRLFWPAFFPFSFLFLSLPNLSPSSSFGFFRSFPFSVLLGTFPSSIPSFLYFYLLIPTALSLDLTKPYGETLSSQEKIEKSKVSQSRGSLWKIWLIQKK